MTVTVVEGKRKAIGVSGPLAAAGTPGPAGPTGAPGGNILAIGLFTALVGLAIPVGTTLIQSSGNAVAGRGQAVYIEDTTLTDPDVAAHPRAIGKSSNGRYFRLAPDQIWRLDHFGVIGDGDVANAAANFAALEAMKAYQDKYKQTGLGYGSGGQLVLWGANKVHIGANTFDLSDVEINILGEHGRGGAEARSALLTTGTTAFRVQNADTTGATGTRSPTTNTGAGSSITGVAAVGDYSGTESEAHGFHIRGSVALKACGTYNFAGDGFFFQGDSAVPTRLGNVNMTLLYDCLAQGCRNGFVGQGADANNIKHDSCQAIVNRAWGFKNLSFLGSNYSNCDASENGLTPGAPPTVCTASGNRYQARKNGTWSNPPSGTTADTADWYYMAAGGANSGLNIATHNPATTYRDGGSYRSDGGGNSESLFAACYHEGGQGFAQIDFPAVVMAGQLAVNVRGVGTIIGDLNGIRVIGGLKVDSSVGVGGTQSDFGPQTGAAADFTHTWHTTNYSTLQYFYRHDFDGTPHYMGRFGLSNGEWVLDGVFGGAFLFNNALVGRIVAGGVNVSEAAAASVATPAAGSQTLFIDTADHKLKRKDSGGTVTVIA